MAVDATLKGEATLLPSPFRSSHVETDLKALAKRIQTLLIMEPGTIPNCVGAGIGIGTYLQEFADNSTLIDLTDRINSQISKYLPSDQVSDATIQFTTDKQSGQTILACIFRLTILVDAKDVLTFKRDPNLPVKDNVVSDFYF
jgi:hypothetical protein